MEGKTTEKNASTVKKKQVSTFHPMKKKTTPFTPSTQNTHLQAKKKKKKPLKMFSGEKKNPMNEVRKCTEKRKDRG